jgi:putative colanic acid biosysnthesis UDP-glucose lipid carrier transferase
MNETTLTREYTSGLLRQHGRLFHSLLRFFDIGLVALAGWLAYALRFEAFRLPAIYEVALLIGVLLTAVVLPRFGVYRAWRGGAVLEEIGRITLAWWFVAVLMSVLAFFAQMGADYSRIWGAGWFVLGWLLLLASRVLLRYALNAVRARGRNIRHVLVVGSDGLGAGVAARLLSAPWTGLRVAALFGEAPGNIQDLRRGGERLKTRPDMGGIRKFVEQEGIDQVWLALPLSEERKIRAIYDELRQTTVDVRLVPEVSGLRLLNRSITDVAGLPVVDLSYSPMNGGNEWVKLIEDQLLALTILILTSPLLLVIACAVKLTSPGPVLFRQKRHGLGGGEIEVYKFRSMVHRENADSEAVQAGVDDRRVTRLGAFLRRTSLDELPQLINVLQGRMSMVGPRPHPVWLNEMHMSRIDSYAQRHKVKPGITGWAQVNGYRGETDTLEKMQKRVEYDLYYIENWSVWFDLRIILLTIFKGFTSPNAH